MKRLWCLLLAPLVMAAAPIALIADLSQRQIDINTRFTGTELIVFGAIQYPAGAVPDAPPDIVVVVRGPAEPVTVRRKSRVAGIWLNTAAVRFESVPGFYALASTRPVPALADDRITAIYEIGINNLQLSPANGDAALVRDFEAGLIAAKRQAGLFSEQTGGVVVTRGVLYSARIPVPSAVPVGEYQAEIHLIRKGRVLASTSAPISINKSGFERWLYVAAQDHSLAYGLSAVLVALLAGAAAASIVRRN